MFAGLVNMPWLHRLKTRYEQQKERYILEKRSNYFWNTYKELIQQQQYQKTDRDSQQSSGSVLKEHCVGVSFLIDLQLGPATLLTKRLQ